jgi:hypothetical protein
MRLEFVEPLMPTLVEKSPEGYAWIHEAGPDGRVKHLRGEESDKPASSTAASGGLAFNLV